MTEKEKQEALNLCRLYGPNNCWTGGTGRMASLLLKALQTIDSDAKALQTIDSDARTAQRWGPLDRLCVELKNY